MKKLISCMLILITLLTSSVALSGCGNQVEEAENHLKVYSSALLGFNTSAMKKCVVGENDEDIGFSVENISDGYIQTDGYKKSIEDMYRALAKTFVMTIDSKEAVDKETVKIKINLKYANVDETAMTEYTNRKVDEYVAKHPSFYDLNDIDQNDTAIAIIADAYKQYLQITNRLDKDFTITLSKRSGSWKIHTEDNESFFSFLEVLFG